MTVMPVTFDVGIVGAGIHGAAAAYHLSAKGLRTVVFERDAPAGGPTGESSAICRAYYTTPFLAGCARDSIEMLRSFETITGQDAEFRRTGLLFLHPPEDEERVRESAGQMSDLGIPVEVLSREAVGERFPALDLVGIGIAAWEPEAGYADPVAATTGLVRAAAEGGAEVRTGEAVASLERADRGGAIVETVGGDEVRCARLLIAAGPWTRSLAAQLGVDLPLTVERHIVGAYRRVEGVDVPAHGDLLGGYCLRPEGDDLLPVGSLHAAPQVDPDDYDRRAAREELERLAVPVIERVPGLEQASIHSGWASLYDVSPDWQPVIGEVAPEVFVDAGTSGHGFKLAPALGRHVADLVAGDQVDPGLAAFQPSRFAEGGGLVAGYGEARMLG